jgi:hypothetical protein
MRSLLYFISACEDRKHLTQSDADRERLQNLIDILIPVAKAYVSDRAVDVCSLAVQVYGGYGYTSEYPVAQLYRDVRVIPIYEGTNGIQAIDLLGRKLTMRGGRLLEDLIGRIEQTIDAAKAVESIDWMAVKVADAVDQWRQAAMHLRKRAGGAEMLSALAHACPLMEVTGEVVFAWMHLWRAVLAARGLENKPKKKDALFYQGQLKSAEYFLRTVLPVTSGKVAAIVDTCSAAVEIPDGAFGGI